MALPLFLAKGKITKPIQDDLPPALFPRCFLHSEAWEVLIYRLQSSWSWLVPTLLEFVQSSLAPD